MRQGVRRSVRSAFGVACVPLTVALAALALSGGERAGAQQTPNPTAQPARQQTTAVPGARGKRVCFAYQDLETEFWVAGHTSILRSSQTQGVQVIERNANEDANRQLEQVRDCISQRVDGIIIIPQDGASAVTIAQAANRANIPIGIFNRPPANNNARAITVVADNYAISVAAMEHMASQAQRLGRQVKPLILVGDLGDPNAVERKRGFDAVIAKYPNVFSRPIEVATRWDAATALAGLQNAMQANPDVGLIFTSSDFMYPQIRAVLQPLGKWQPIGNANHVILGGVDGDSTACGLMRQRYVDATGVQDLFFEADAVLTAVLRAAVARTPQPNQRINDPGFALTQANIGTMANRMWGCVVPPPRR